ncbi:hypothetical protein KI387_033258, partial [Taxus chinensis]
TTLDLVDEGGLGASLHWVGYGMGGRLVLYELGLGVSKLGVTLDVLGLGDGELEMGLKDRIVLGLGDEV